MPSASSFDAPSTHIITSVMAPKGKKKAATVDATADVLIKGEQEAEAVTVVSFIDTNENDNIAAIGANSDGSSEMQVAESKDALSGPESNSRGDGNEASGEAKSSSSALEEGDTIIKDTNKEIEEAEGNITLINNQRGDEGILEGTNIGYDDEDRVSSDDDDDESDLVIHIERGTRRASAFAFERGQAAYVRPQMAPLPGGDDETKSAEEVTADDDLDKLRFRHHRTAFDVNLDTLEVHPWRDPGVDLSDYFNYGFNEKSWKNYSEMQLKHRSKIGLGPGATLSLTGATKKTESAGESAAAGQAASAHPPLQHTVQPPPSIYGPGGGAPFPMNPPPMPQQQQQPRFQPPAQFQPPAWVSNGHIPASFGATPPPPRGMMPFQPRPPFASSIPEPGQHFDARAPPFLASNGRGGRRGGSREREDTRVGRDASADMGDRDIGRRGDDRDIGRRGDDRDIGRRGDDRDRPSGRDARGRDSRDRGKGRSRSRSRSRDRGRERDRDRDRRRR